MASAPKRAKKRKGMAEDLEELATVVEGSREGDYNAWKDATSETAPWHLWLDAVLMGAKASMDEAKPFMDKLKLWFKSGEAVWMAADGLKQFVKGRKIGARADREAGFMRGALKWRR